VNPGAALLLGLVFGFAGYREVGRFQKRYGRTPFGWPAIVWGVICFLSFLIGIVLLAIGERIGRKRAAATPMYGGSYTQPVYGAPPSYGPHAYVPPAQHPLGYGPPLQQPPVYGAPAQPPQPLNGDILPK
jgi:hypothetical protein